ncbi:MAG: peptidoglycan-binding domain-containing protein [Roseovarius sp.]
MQLRSIFTGAVTAFILAMPAHAEDLALLIGNRGQALSMQEPGGAGASAFREALANAGFRVIEAQDRDIRDMRLAAIEAETAVEDGEVERLVIVALGPFATDGQDSWVLSNNAQGTGRIAVGALGLSMTALTALAVQADVPAVVLAAPGVAPERLGFGLEPGLGAYRQDKDVTYVTGPSTDLADLLAGLLLAEGVSFDEVARSAPRGVEVDGNLSPRMGLMGPAAPGRSDEAVELGFWQAVQAMDTIAAYRMYLGEYRNGQYAGEAEARIAYLRDEPEREAKSIEEGLGLSRDDRREIQRNLSLLGFDPKGIDGIFGPGSRTAIGAWQQANGFTGTGYITGNQLLRLRDQAAEEAARRAEEARKRREQEERLDRAYWRDTGRGADETGLRSYLERYPDGLFSEIAEERLAEIEDAKRSEAEREEREAWDAARASDSEEAYRAFLNTYPESTFAEAARARLEELTQAEQNAAEVEAARQQERQFTSTLVGRVLIEQRLAQLGFEPGNPDGTFTRDTRRAIRRFQSDYGLPVTGYVSQQTMVQLLAGR